MKCKNCKERFIGCHNSCKHYLIFREKIDEAKDIKIENQIYMCYLTDSIIRMRGSRKGK